jgi:hypothetical protein
MTIRAMKTLDSVERMLYTIVIEKRISRRKTNDPDDNQAI